MALNFRNSHVTAWRIPLSYAAGALIVGFRVPRLAYSILPGYVSTVSVNAAIGIYSAVASGMIALTGIVFSLTLRDGAIQRYCLLPSTGSLDCARPDDVSLNGCVYGDVSLRPC